MTDVEYPEKAIDHLQALDSHVADRILNRVNGLGITPRGTWPVPPLDEATD